MSLKDQLRQDLHTAMKKGEKEKTSTLRMLTAAISNREIDKKEQLNDQEVVAVIYSQVKQLKDAIRDFIAGGREDLTESAEQEIEILEKYLPEQMSEVEIERIIDKVIEDLGGDDSVQLGQVMGQVMSKLKGRVDGVKVREITQRKLS